MRMASSESRHRRHHDSFSSRSRDLDPYYNSRYHNDPYQTDSQVSEHRHDRHHHRRRTHNPEDGASLGADLRHDLQEPSRAPHRTRSATHLRPEEPRMRRTWPPPPFAEDEARSVAREHPRRRWLDDEPPERGAIDQDPVLIDVVLPSTNSQRQSTRTGRPPMPGEVRHSSRKMPGLDTDFDAIPEFTKREPSPYSFRPDAPRNNRYSGETFLSPESLTPQTTLSAGSEKSRSGSQSHTTSSKYSSNRRGEASDSSYSDESDTEARKNERKPARYSFVKSDLNRKSLRTSLHHVSEENVAHRARASSSSRTDRPRNLSSEARRPEERDGGRYRRSPEMSSAGPSPPKERSDGSGSSRGGSPTRRLDPRGNSPGSDRPFLPSPPHSRPGSKNGSRAHSPLSSVSSAAVAGATVGVVASQAQATLTEREALPIRSSTTPNTNTRQSRYDSARKDSVHEWKPSVPRVDVQSPSPARPPPRSSTLPYPEEDLIDKVSPLPYPTMDTPLMPSEEQFQYTPTSPRGVQQPTSPRVVSPSNPQAQGSNRRTTVSEDTPNTPSRSDTHNTRGEAQKNAGQPKQPLPLPPCPRGEPSSKYDDWYNLKGMKKFDVCPYCYDDIIAPAGFKHFFVSSPSKPSGVKTKCNFSSPWIRLAWLLNDQRGRKDLDILYTLAAIATAEPECPGSEEAAREWYGLRDEYGDQVSSFYVCQCDRRNIESLLPTLQGTFVRIPNSRQKRMCSVRKESYRFSKYLDLLVDIDAEAKRKQREPDLRSFIELIRQHSYRLECPRDNLVLDQTWHFIPHLPEFTVCEECYDEIVYPWIQEGSSVAKLFNRNMKFVPGENEAIRAGRIGGNSCQLYSPRMRRIFRAAMEDSDFRYLERKAKDRKRIELELQTDMKKLTRAEKEARAGKVGYGARTGAPWDLDRIRDEKRKLIETWQDVE